MWIEFLNKRARLSRRGGVILIRKCTILFTVILIALLSACSSASNDNTDGIESVAGYGESKDNTDEIEPIAGYGEGKDNTDGIEPIAEYNEGKADMEGIVLDIGERVIKLARNLSPNEYEEIKNESVTKLHNEDVAGERALGLIDLIYENKKEFYKGDKVEVWIDGDIMEISPPRAKAKKIVVKK